MRTGDRLRMARDRMRMTQKDLAGDEFHRSLISQIETGLIEPSLHTLTVLADRVGLPSSYFIESDGEKERAEQASTDARELVTRGDYDQAYLTLLDAVTFVASFPLKASLLLQMGNVLLLAHRPSEALAYLQTAQRYLRVGDDARELIDALFHTGRAQTRMGRVHDAIDSYNEALWLLDHALLPGDRDDRRQKRHRQVDLTLSIGKGWARLGELARAREWLGQAADVATDAELYFELSQAHQSIALVGHLAGDYGAARYHTNIALSLLEGPDHPVGRALSLAYVGQLHLIEGEPEPALRYLEEAVTSLEPYPMYQLLPAQGLAIAYFSLGQYDRCAEWSDRALAILGSNSPMCHQPYRHARLISTLAFVARASLDGIARQDGYLQQEVSWYHSQGFVEAAWETIDSLSAFRN